MNRVRHLLLIVYWSIRHLSVSRGRWVAAYVMAESFHPARDRLATDTEKRFHHPPAARDSVVHER